MLETELDYINSYTNESLTVARDLITQNNGLLLQLITIFIICSLLKIFIFMKDKKHLKMAIFYASITPFPILLLGCITLLVNTEYNTGIEVNSIIEHILIHYMLCVFFIFAIFNKYKDWILLKLSSISNYFRGHFKNIKEALDEEKQINNNNKKELN